ncbi:hypothetical protein [Frigoriglobus tundricola]|uniref:Uncharacterized protein n=1 Tax=Frigoriglobus tundricola TaxID=2774151 RepID=A0A6M5YW55_9BACT|nr:hypothetical protein [Frigoriglobus tundricola]QJW97443.1 hypothetical protein FTUN_5017 [Frigoriglobus tundricola]
MPQTALLTAAQWAALPDPADKVDRLCPPVSQRKLRLFGCYCCRRCWGSLPSEGREALTVAERFAEGRASDAERLAAFRRLVESSGGYIGPHPVGRPWCTATLTDDLFTCALALVIATDAETLLRAGDGSAISDTFEDMRAIHRIADSCRMTRWLAEDDARQHPVGTRGTVGRVWDRLLRGSATNRKIHQQEVEYQAAHLNDIFGSPFRPVPFAPAWRTDTALALARQMYESREFGAMPILADALQDAGCDGADVLNHCRDASANHVRGCWVVDLVLGAV